MEITDLCAVKGCTQHVELTPDLDVPSVKTFHRYTDTEQGFIISHPPKVKNGYCFYHNNCKGVERSRYEMLRL